MRLAQEMLDHLVSCSVETTLTWLKIEAKKDNDMRKEKEKRSAHQFSDDEIVEELILPPHFRDSVIYDVLGRKNIMPYRNKMFDNEITRDKHKLL